MKCNELFLRPFDLDSISQIALGAAVGEAVLGRKAGNKALLWGAVAGTIPDLDIVTNLFTDEITANEMHRGFSHSIVFCVLAAPVLGWLVSKAHKTMEHISWKNWAWLFFWGLFTHPLLDAHTTWGTQLFWPFEYRLAYCNIFVIDPLYTLPLIICLLLLVRKKRNNLTRQKLNKYGLVISSAYMLLTIIFKWIGYQTFEKSLQKQNIEYTEIDTRPTPFNSLLWTANVETKDSFLIGWYSLLDESNQVDFIHYPKNYELLKPIKNKPIVQRLQKLADHKYIIKETDNGLDFIDLRFGQTGVEDSLAPFVFRYELTQKNDTVYAKMAPREVENGKQLLVQLFKRVGGK